MKKLKVIENELVPVYETDKGEKVVYGSELHAVLQVKSNYREWINRRFSDIDASENEDFQGIEISTPSGQSKKDYIIKLDIAKEIAMLERNEKGKQVRRYFIQIEKKYKAQEAFPKTIQGQIQLLAKGYLELEQKLDDIDKDLQDFKKDMPLLGVECQKITRAKNQKVVPLMGGKEASAYKDNSLRGKVYKDINNQLCREFDVDTYKAIKRNQVDTAVKIIENYQLPMVLQEQIDLANRQISFV